MSEVLLEFEFENLAGWTAGESSVGLLLTLGVNLRLCLRFLRPKLLRLASLSLLAAYSQLWAQRLSSLLGLLHRFSLPLFLRLMWPIFLPMLSGRWIIVRNARLTLRPLHDRISIDDLMSLVIVFLKE